MGQAGEKGPAVGPQVIFGLDTTGRCTLSIGPGLADLGVKPGQLVGVNLLELYADDHAAVEHLRQALAGETFTVERRFAGRILSVFYQPVFDDDGAVSGAMGVSTDVTEQRRIEDEARAAKERASLLADLSNALTREVPDPDAVLRVAIRSVTEAVAEVGAMWVRTPGGHSLEPKTVWHVDKEARKAWYDWSAQLPPQAHLPLAEAEQLEAPHLLDLENATGWGWGEPHGEFLAGLTRRFGLQTGLRVPLRSRGLLVGVIDVARGARQGGFTDADIALVTDVAERCALALDNALLLEAQRKSREDLVKFQALADASENLIAITSDEGREVYTNPRVAEAGIKVAEEDVWLTVADVAGRPVEIEIRRSLEKAGRWSGDLAITTDTGEMVVYVDVFSLSHPDTGTSLGTAWIAQDVTDLRSTEAALREANSDLKQFKALVEASPDFIAIANPDGHVKYVNPGGRQMLEMDPDVDPTTTRIPDYVTPEVFALYREVVQPVVMEHGHWAGEATLLSHRGKVIPVAVASFLVHDPETGEPFALATVQRDITERLAAETALRELADQRQALLTRLVDAQDAERAQIAADVHDDPVQALAAVDLRLGLLSRRLGEHAPALLETLGNVQASVAGATDRLRTLLFDLEPPDLEHGLTGALHRAAGEIFDSTSTRWVVDGDREPDVPDATRAIAYRIAKEAMMNARKHAKAHHVVVTVAGRDHGLEVCVSDDGVGLGPHPIQTTPGHRGLFTMQDRAEIAGGRCTISNRRPHGTLVDLWLPVPPPPAE
ncbi:MAG TPA: PAS domain-containing protein [Nocardioidaceae bacterium]